MSTHNTEIADAFDELGDLLSIQGESPFRVRAYRRAARVVRSLPQELDKLKAESDYDAIPGIGKDLAAKIAELVKSGRLRALESLRREVPSGVRELLSLPGMGPMRVRALVTALHVKDPEDLRRALVTGQVGLVRGFGELLQRRLREALVRAPAEGVEKRFPLRVGEDYAEPLRRYLASVPGVSRVEIAGSYRRGRDTVGDLDLVVNAPAQAGACAALGRYPDLRQLLVSGPTKASGVLRNGLHVDVRAVSRGRFGAALLYSTGSKEHSIRLRRLAQERGWKLSEYGLFRNNECLAGDTEEGVYRALGLPWIAPELREDRGEIEAALKGALPTLIERGDLKGDLHVHTDASLAQDSIEVMVAAAQAQKLSYIAITDHAKHLGIVDGLDAERLSRQCDAIDAMNSMLHEFVILKGAEVDILEDGRLALPDAELARLDVVVIAVHSHFGLPQARQTRRLLRALERPYVSILAHPTGRLIAEREPYAFDFERVLEAVRERRCFLEVNGQPSRLDLDDMHVKAARDHGVMLSIASDAHAADQLANLEGGVRQARRGWVRNEDVINARSITGLRTLLGRARGRD